jgi:hypothetical protein
VTDAFGLHEGRVLRLAPNWRASVAVYRFEQGAQSRHLR